MNQRPGMQFIDSHTEGEPTRVIVAGGPPLGGGPLIDRRQRFQAEFDEYRTAAILEPRGYDAVVGALLCEPHDPTCDAGVIFFNNTGYLNMCGHGAIGVAVTLHHMGRVDLGPCRLETPVGVVTATLLSPNRAAVENVPSYRYRTQVEVQVPGYGVVSGDIAWGGNWFFLCSTPPCRIALQHLDTLVDATQSIRRALEAANITGADGAEIDHIEFVGPAEAIDGDGRSFVMCPGGEYDRSPCGTGTSAKLACLAADGKLKPGEVWVQESVIGSRFAATYQPFEGGQIVPTITGTAYVTAEGRLLQDLADPFRNGIAARAIV